MSAPRCCGMGLRITDRKSLTQRGFVSAGWIVPSVVLPSSRNVQMLAA